MMEVSASLLLHGSTLDCIVLWKARGQALPPTKPSPEGHAE